MDNLLSNYVMMTYVLVKVDVKGAHFASIFLKRQKTGGVLKHPLYTAMHTIRRHIIKYILSEIIAEYDSVENVF